MQARRSREGKLFGLSTGWLHFAFLQILIGALVAGIDAGRTFTDWPLMHGSFLPPGWLELQPVWRNFFENPGTVQFVHRMTGYLLGVAALIAWVMTRRSPVPRLRLWFTWVVVVLLCQTGLGIATVRSGAMLWLALAHQLGAVITLVVILRARFFALYPPEQSIRRTAR
jgi:cytochrome c oxidase assembly protein subunit 15